MDPNSTTNLTTVSLGLTKGELWIQLVLFYLIIAGLSAPLGNMVIVYTLLTKSKKFRTHFFVIIGWLSFCRIFIGLQTTVLAMFRILALTDIISYYQPRFICYLINIGVYTESTVEVLLLLILVIDRLVAIAAVRHYRRITLKRLHITCLLIFLSMKLKLVPAYYGLHRNDTLLDIVKCANIFSPAGENFNLFSQNIDLILIILVLSMYFSLIIYIKRQTRMKMMNEAQLTSLKRQLSVIPAVRNVIFLHTACTLTAKLLLALGTFMDHPESFRLVAYGGICWAVDAVANISVILYSSPELRKELPYPRCAKTQVEDFEYQMQRRNQS